MNFKKMFGFSPKESVNKDEGGTFIKVYVSGDINTPVNQRDIMVKAHCNIGEETYLAQILFMISSPLFVNQLMGIAKEQFAPELFEKFSKTFEKLDNVKKESKHKPLVRPLEVFGRSDDNENLSIN